MHELAITERILNICLDEAKKQKLSKITAIHLQLGPFSGIVPDCIQMYLDLLAENTVVQGAVVKATVLPLKVRCRDCGRTAEITRQQIACPHCKSLRLQMLSGNEFTIEHLEAETEETA